MESEKNSEGSMIIYEEKKEKARRSGKRRMDQDSEMSEDKGGVSERKQRMKKKISQRKICKLRNGKEMMKKTIERGKKDADRTEIRRQRQHR